MSRRRWARRCTATRSDEMPCRAYSIVGGDVCRAHGGSTPQARRAAAMRLFVASVDRAIEHERARHRERLLDWYLLRVLHAADVLGIEPVAVREVDLSIVGAFHGWPRGLELDAKPLQRVDRRFAANSASGGSGA